MGYACKIIADSVSELGYRLTTFEVTFPRIVLAEFNTHRMFSRNSASSRAIPVVKQLRRILEDPFMPVYWGRNRPGMQATEELNPSQQRLAKEVWHEALYDSVYRVIELQLGPYRTTALLHNCNGKYDTTWGNYFGDWISKRALLQRMLADPIWDNLKSLDDALLVHKQIANRLLEPYMWHTVIVTATEWSNFFALRTDANPQPEIRIIAELMRDTYTASQPKLLRPGEWHVPYVNEEEMHEFGFDWERAKKLAVGRSARVSYLTHDGKFAPEKDIELHDRLARDGHVSPYEHVARPMTAAEMPVIWFEANLPVEKRVLEAIQSAGGTWRRDWSGNFRGFVQYRKTLEFEDDYSKVLTLRQPT